MRGRPISEREVGVPAARTQGPAALASANLGFDAAQRDAEKIELDRGKSVA